MDNEDKSKWKHAMNIYFGIVIVDYNLIWIQVMIDTNYDKIPRIANWYKWKIVFRPNEEMQ